MGFYGNIKSSSKSQFAFDKTYANRHEMDEALFKGDGIYVGRYVLVDYDEGMPSEYQEAPSCFINKNDLYTISYQTSEKVLQKDILINLFSDSEKTISLINELEIGKVYKIPSSYSDTCYNKNTYWTVPTIEEDGQTKQLYFNVDERILTTVKSAATTACVWLTLEVEDSSNYLVNYNIDQQYYAMTGRGYDSTVWQKVFKYNDKSGIKEEAYVMIAELNSVVPTFDISADAPTLTPISPHFDADSTNVYYRVHWQPQ